MTKTTHFKGTRLKANAVIRYNIMDGQTVVYFRQGKRFFKMLDGKRIRPMSLGYKCFAELAYRWSPKTSVTLVEHDEEVKYNGKSVKINMEPFTVNTNHVNVI